MHIEEKTHRRKSSKCQTRRVVSQKNFLSRLSELTNLTIQGNYKFSLTRNKIKSKPMLKNCCLYFAATFLEQLQEALSFKIHVLVI